MIHTKQHLVALIPEGQALMLNILRYPNELRDSDGLALPPKTAKAAGVNAREMELARKLIGRHVGTMETRAIQGTRITVT